MFEKFFSVQKAWYYAVLYVLFVFIFLIEALVTPHLNYVIPFVDYGGTFKYPYLQIGEVSISLYWSAHIFGIICMMLMCFYRSKKYQISSNVAIITTFLLAVLGYVGAKILYIFENWKYTLQNGISLNGVSFFGTVFFMPPLIFIMALIFRKKPIEFLDYCTPAGLVMLTCIRTGCFMKGCCHGLTLWIFNRPIVLPSQLIECVLDLILLNIIFNFEKQEKYRGKLYVIFMGGYGILRFLVEFIRDTPKNTFHLSHGQWFSICCVVICLTVFFGFKS